MGEGSEGSGVIEGDANRDSPMEPVYYDPPMHFLQYNSDLRALCSLLASDLATSNRHQNS